VLARPTPAVAGGQPVVVASDQRAGTSVTSPSAVDSSAGTAGRPKEQ
jgi:hypothetical protein